MWQRVCEKNNNQHLNQEGIIHYLKRYIPSNCFFSYTIIEDIKKESFKKYNKMEKNFILYRAISKMKKKTTDLQWKIQKNISSTTHLIYLVQDRLDLAKFHYCLDLDSQI